MERFHWNFPIVKHLSNRKCNFKWVLLTSKSLFRRKQTSSIWFGDREMQTFREKTYTRNNSFMNYQQIYSFNQWNEWEDDTFLSTLPENNLKICYRLQNIASLATERTQLPHPKKIFPRSSPFYRMWRFERSFVFLIRKVAVSLSQSLPFFAEKMQYGGDGRHAIPKWKSLQVYSLVLT